MKLVLKISLFLLAMSTFSDKSFSLTEYQIRSFCSKDRKKSTCIKNLKEKKSHLQKGKLIEIPVIPYKGN